MIKLSGDQLEIYLDDNPKYSHLLRTLLRNYGGVFDNLVNFNISSVAEKADLQENECLSLFEDLQQQEIIEFSIAKHDASITFLVPREDESTINPVSGFISKYNKTKREKISAVLDFVQNDQVCKQIQLLKYFGETKPEKCGRCSVCNSETDDLSRDEMNEIFLALQKLLKSRALDTKEISSLLNYKESSVLKVIRLLVERGILEKTITNKYKISIND